MIMNTNRLYLYTYRYEWVFSNVTINFLILNTVNGIFIWVRNKEEKIFFSFLCIETHKICIWVIVCKPRPNMLKQGFQNSVISLYVIEDNVWRTIPISKSENLESSRFYKWFTQGENGGFLGLPIYEKIRGNPKEIHEIPEIRIKSRNHKKKTILNPSIKLVKYKRYFVRLISMRLYLCIFKFGKLLWLRKICQKQNHVDNFVFVMIVRNLKSHKYKGRGTFFFKIGPIRNHWQFHVKLSAIEDTTVGSHSWNFQLDWSGFTWLFYIPKLVFSRQKWRPKGTDGWLFLQWILGWFIYHSTQNSILNKTVYLLFSENR
jgi:hypothetical protein